MTASESFSVKEKDKLLSFSTRSFSSTDNQYSNLNMNKRHNCANLNNMSGISSCTNNRHSGYGLSKDDNHVSKSMQSGRWRKSNPSLNLSHSYFSDKDVDEKGIKKTKDSSVKNSSTLSLHIAAYENAIEASDLKQKNSLAEASESTAKAAWKSKKFCDSSSTIAFSIFDGFEFPRQQQDGPQEPSFMHFTSSQRLISPNANANSPASVQPSPSIVTTPVASQASQVAENDSIVTNVPDLLKKGRFNTGLVPLLPKLSQTEDDLIFDVDKFAERCKSVIFADPPEVASRYANFLENLPKSVSVVSVSDLMECKCCVAWCCSKLSPDLIRRERLKLPTSSQTKESMYYVLLNYQFFLILHSLTDDRFQFVINRNAVCSECFCYVYLISRNRFESCCRQILDGFKLPLPHGNSGRRPEHVESLKRLGKLVNTVYKIAEPHPSGTGYLMPPSLTKDSLIKRAGYDTDKMVNPTREIRKIAPTLHLHASNTLTKCEKCIKLKNLCQSDVLSPEERAYARQHYNKHLENIDVDNRTSYIAQDASRNSTDILSMAHDGMGMHHSKYPYCLESKGKTITDASRMLNPMNMAVVHRKYKDCEDEIHLYWNPNRLAPTGANAIVTQIIHAISHCEIVSNVISINLDNCSVNKNYVMMTALGMMLLWVPALTKILVCTKEVGHTHNDVDQRFGTIANALKRREVYSPQGYVTLTDEIFKNVKTNNVLLPVYDFESILKPISDRFGQVHQNHYFEISKDADGEVIVKIARFIRSEQFIMNEKSPSDSFRLFKETPDLTNLPQILPVSPIDLEKHNKLCQEAAKGTIPRTGVQELLNLPDFLQQLPPPESFEQVLTRIRSKVIPPVANVYLSTDLNNVNMDDFISRMVEKINPTLVESAPPQDVISVPQPDSTPSDSRITDPSEAETAEAPPAKKKRGRPRKVLK